MCCRCSNPYSMACYHVGPCTLCALHGGQQYYPSTPLPTAPQGPLAPITPLYPPIQVPITLVPTTELEFLREILKELREIKAKLYNMP